jgi:hypothetical protein
MLMTYTPNTTQTKPSATNQPRYNNTLRKFYTQMNCAEQRALWSVVQSYTKWTLTEHAREEAYQDYVRVSEIFDTIRAGKIMEANIICENDVRVLIRKTLRGRSVAVVLSLCTGEIKTVFANSIESGARMPNFDNYKLTADFSVIRGINAQNLNYFQFAK